jgi:ABC-type multidrug transport system ATPase subunit
MGWLATGRMLPKSTDGNASHQTSIVPFAKPGGSPGVCMKPVPESAGLPVLQARGLHFGYGQGALFSNWSCQISPGLTVVRGGESTGKSTLVRLLAGAIPAEAGELELGGVNLAREPQRYRQNLAWNDPKDTAFDKLIAAEFFERTRQQHSDFNASGLDELAAGLCLQEQLHKPIYMLSTGTRRKVLLTASLASGAKLVLLDDPFAALDMASILFLKKCLSAWAQQPSKACVIAVHELPRDLRTTQTIDLNLL